MFNPYWDLINIADFIFVTADSVSMTSDALTTGKPTYIIPIYKLKQKIKDFQTGLKKKLLVFIIKSLVFGNIESLRSQKLSESK